MDKLKVILKWVFIILFFPLSLLFVAYFRQRKAKREYFNKEEEEDFDFDYE